jgi:eukaryotic-like serine/threonine-protein kinase
VSADALIAGRYRLEEELGRGGMGRVWRAYDELLHRSVAVKEVHFPPDLPVADRERLAGRTLREARAVAAIDTPAAVRVFDIVEQDGRPWIVMELVRGGTLTELLRRSPTLPPAEVARIGLAVLDALEAAHAAGVLHRDVKPSNILIGDDGRVALTDFGIATVDGDASSGDTSSGVIVGSPSYIAPERAHGHRPTAASDLWSLGATLWTAAEGRPPYEGATAFAVMASVTSDDPPTCTRCPEALADVLRALMDRDPAARPTATAVRSALTEIRANGTAPQPQPEPEHTALLPLSFDRTTVLGQRDSDAAATTDMPPRVTDPAPPPPPPRPAPDPEPVPVAAPPARATGGRRSRFVVVGAVALGLAVAAAVIVAVITTSGPSHHAHTAAGRHGKAVSHPTRSASAPATTTALPAGWSRYTDPELHWKVGVPPGWTRSTTSSGTQFSDPAGGRYFLIATRYPAGSSAVKAWQDSERSFSTSHAGYQRVTLHTIDIPGAKDAADWEFTYSDGGASLRALDRAEVFGTRGYAIYEQSHTDQWASSQPLFNRIQRSFVHGSTGA